MRTLAFPGEGESHANLRDWPETIQERSSIPRFWLRVTRKLQSRLAMDDVKALDTRSNMPYNPRASLRLAGTGAVAERVLRGNRWYGYAALASCVSC